ncbi:hypothetical protein D3C71_1867370 [compost metagenome]
MLKDFGDVDAQQKHEISYHVRLLMEIGLIEGKIQSLIGGGGPSDFAIIRLTWSGHEFLDSIRNDTVWNKTKEAFASKGLDMTFDSIKTVASWCLTSMLDLAK